MKILAIALVGMLWVGCLSAQEYTFRVLINKGQNQVKAGNDWLPIKVGASLKSADELKISQNGYLGLVHHTGKPLEVKDAGPHKVVDLAAKVKEGPSVLNKYTDFILSSKTEKVTTLTATGAVTRGSGEIKVYLPKQQQAIVFNDAVTIAWAEKAKTSGYIVQFNSMFGDELDRHEVRDTTLSIDLSSEKFANEDNIILKIISGNDPKILSEEFVLKKVSAADRKRIQSAMRDISPLMQEKNALNMLYLASFYEDNGLLIDASTAYQEAVKLAPQVTDYEDAFRQFVLRNQLQN